jgi:hypothetical protein
MRPMQPQRGHTGPSRQTIASNTSKAAASFSKVRLLKNAGHDRASCYGFILPVALGLPECRQKRFGGALVTRPRDKSPIRQEQNDLAFRLRQARGLRTMFAFVPKAGPGFDFLALFGVIAGSIRRNLWGLLLRDTWTRRSSSH